MGTHVLPTCGLTDVALEVSGQLRTQLHVLVLDELEHDIAFGGVGIVALIDGLIVLLHEDHGVLALRHLQVLNISHAVTVTPALAEGVCLIAMGEAFARQGVDMNRHEEVCLVVVGKVRTFLQSEILIRLSRIVNDHVRAVALHNPAEGQRITQRQRLLLRLRSHTSRVMTAVSGIEDEDELVACQHGRQRQEAYI